ncbi:UDP-N-acetylglucosamine transferase subunit ALG14 [Pyrenophora tritici-repentis]|uniref:UDP-N-acetylglucosamine transferase subunit ALG14 n=1 Tax=Pyrenophora tritici-repentis TaxID=45151 RepID=A0A2W1FF44_9PLEO|nr:UDP-N-acetylglucosamine transferase protein [Pyrenophora tritici-repentis]KAI0613410.1 UDP-N-acetylglucosamine transferase subunit ALG14 [Pyrenophora tritici-repentis]KAI1510471.1 Oligosaccharide biosynthesis protein Alg14 [Pyrenophora tritici-repentis]KAI1547000.1 UDP-N-acetylglucosamine transferase subunit ALG14 [Pyrenophora tritici-repentis]KAI1557318.1 UDP-N-acetylglucosamine transferase subunit ALG14 [Pyrenophora tritici-repentis]
MAPPLSSLYTLSFLIAILATLFVAATFRLLAILPNAARSKKRLPRKRPVATRVLIVLGSGGHTHEMFYLLHNLNTRNFTHRTYIVSSGDAFSAQRAANFERELEDAENDRVRQLKEERLQVGEEDVRPQTPTMQITNPEGKTHNLEKYVPGTTTTERPACIGPDHYNITVLPRARKIHQPLLTAPFTCLYTLFSAVKPLLSSPPLLPSQGPTNPYEAAAADLPDLIVTNGPATAVIVVLASLILRFFNVRGADSRGKCKTLYVESFARVKTLSLSGKLLVRVVDRFLVQWEELKGAGGGRAEYLGMLV